MESTLAQKAVGYALSGLWQKALETNLLILTETPDDVDAMNRIARCYSELGETKKAIQTSEKVLKLDSLNPIAQKCILKWETAHASDNHKSFIPSGEDFLEESGRTKMVTLLNPGMSEVFANLNSGDEVRLSAYTHKVSVVDNDDKYIGCLPDDLAARIKNLLKQGNKYQVLIKSNDSKEVTVLIKETDNKSGVASFPPEKIDYVSFTPPELVHRDSPEMPSEDPEI